MGYSKYLNRREFLKKSGNLMGGAIISASAPVIIRESAIKKTPNIVFIITDQMRGDALSCLGDPNARTPNLDMMAENGVLFENGFCNNPICVPSRMSISSGLYPHQHGALNNDGPFFDSAENTFFELFKNEGYKIGFIGKIQMEMEVVKQG